MVEEGAKKVAGEIANKSEQLLSEGWNWIKKKIDKKEQPEVPEIYEEQQRKVKPQRKPVSSFLITESDLNTLIGGPIDTQQTPGPPDHPAYQPTNTGMPGQQPDEANNAPGMMQGVPQGQPVMPMQYAQTGMPMVYMADPNQLAAMQNFNMAGTGPAEPGSQPAPQRPAPGSTLPANVNFNPVHRRNSNKK